MDQQPAKGMDLESLMELLSRSVSLYLNSVYVRKMCEEGMLDSEPGASLPFLSIANLQLTLRLFSFQINTTLFKRKIKLTCTCSLSLILGEYKNVKLIIKENT